MGNREKEEILIGSARLYMVVAAAEMPTMDDLFKSENETGNIKGGASVEYTEETYEEKDDLGRKSKIITIDESVLVKLGLIAWNGNVLKKMIDRCSVTEDRQKGLRHIKIGGAGNAQGNYYAIGLHHEDKTHGDMWFILKGRNTAGATLTLAKDAGSLIEPQFKAMPQDDKGTLLEIVEEINKENAAAEPAGAEE